MTDRLPNRGGPGWRSVRMGAWLVGVPMLVAGLVAARLSGEGGWVDTLAQTGALLVGIAGVSELVARKRGPAAFRTGLWLAITGVLLLGWVNGAVGIIGSEENPANLMYGGVGLVAVAGALLARLRPAGMARAMFATALATVLVAVIAMVGRMGGAHTDAAEIARASGVFVALFVGSGVLFTKAARAAAR